MAEQQVTLNPGESEVVSFEATPTVAKTYQVSVDGLTGSFVAIKAVVEVTSISVSPTSLTTASHEYETYLGLGYWGDPFTIRITFSNPFDYDVWVRPDYAFGHLTGEPLKYVAGTLQGFTAEKLLYFRLLLDTEWAQGDYSYTVDWQQLYHPQNYGSNMRLAVDPDGLRSWGGADYWLKIPAKGTATTVKQAHLGSLEVRAYKCALCGAILDYSRTALKSHYATIHPDVELREVLWGGLWWYWANGGDAVDTVRVPAEGVVGSHDLCVVANKVCYLVWNPHYITVKGVKHLVNWSPVALDPVAAAVPNQITIS